MRTLATTLVLIALGASIPAQSNDIRWESTGGPIMAGHNQVIARQGRFLLVSREWWRSLDGGLTWTDHSRPSRPTRLSATDRHLFGDAIDGVLRSSDMGGSWILCGALPLDGTPRRVVTSIVADDARVYVVVSGMGVFRSEDQCTTWIRLEAPWPNRPVSIRHVNGLRVIVVADGAIYISSDAGMTWTLVDEGVVRDLPSFASTCDGAILAGTAGGILATHDGGRSWTPMGLAGRRVRSLVVSRCNEMFAAVQDGGQWTQSVFRSQNGGVTWATANNGLIRHPIDLSTDGDGFVYAAGTAGAFRWSAEGDWQPIGPTQTRVESVVTTPWGDRFAAAHGMLYQARGSEGPWRPLLFGHEARTSMHAPDHRIARIVFVTPGQHLLAASLGNGVLRSRDRGETWQRVGLERYVHSLVSTRMGSILAGTAEGIFRSPDDGESWIERSIGLTAFRIHAVTAAEDGSVYAGSWNGGVFKSTDDGDRWRPIGAPRGRGVHALLVLRNGHLLAGTQMGLFRLNAAAGIWEPLSLPAQRGISPAIRALHQDARGVVLAGSEHNGVFASFDEGVTWTTANDGLTTDGVFSFAGDADGRIVTGTSSGVFVRR